MERFGGREKNMRKQWLTCMVVLAAVLWISACGQKTESGAVQTTSAAETSANEKDTQDSLEVSGENEENEDGAVIIGGADGPTAIFVASRYDLSDIDEAVKYYISKENEGGVKEYPLQTVAHRTLKQEETERGTVRYLYYGELSYQISPDGLLLDEEEAGGRFGLVKITLSKDENGEYQLVDYWTPGDGGLLDDDISENFPEDIQEEAINAHTKYGNEISGECLKQAREFSDAFLKGLEYSAGDAKGEENADPILEPTTIDSGEGPDVFQPTTMASDELPEAIPVK